MIKLAFVNTMDAYSGGEIVLQRIIRGLDKNRFRILVYTKNTKFVTTLNCDECEVVIFDTQYQLKKQRNFIAILKLCRNFLISAKYVYEMKYVYHIDILHSNTLTSNIYFSFWAKIFNIKLIAYSHDLRYGLIYKVLYRYIVYCADKVIVISDAVKKNWLEHGGSEEKLVKIYNGVDSDFF